MPLGWRAARLGFPPGLRGRPGRRSKGCECSGRREAGGAPDLLWAWGSLDLSPMESENGIGLLRNQVAWWSSFFEGRAGIKKDCL